jgi:hypothetical protein
MTHCSEWEELFKKRPEACVESADYRRKVEKWLATLEEIRKRGIQVTTKIFPEGAHRVLLTLDDEMKDKALNYICHRLDRGEKITAPDLKKSIAVWEGKAASTSCPIRKNKTNEFSNTPDNDVKSENIDEESNQNAPDAPIAKTLKEKYGGHDQQQASPVLEPEPAFMPASQLGKPLIERPGIKIIPVQLTQAQAEERITSIVRGWFTPKQNSGWERLRKLGELGETDLEILTALADEAVERIGGA